VAKSIRVALVNDFMIVLEGLRSILKSSEPEIQVVELDIRKAPRRGVDVTLLDTYGEVETLDERVRALRSMPDNGAIVVFSFSDQPQAVRRALGAGAQGFISKAVPRHEIIDGIKAAARGERVGFVPEDAARTDRRCRAVARTRNWPDRTGERTLVIALDWYDESPARGRTFTSARTL
jgi:DNA-binding NarL/FixJ family response regulator